jgi:hypothetical protein
MKISNLFEVLSAYARAELYAVSSIKNFSDVHLMWGPAYARLACGIGARNFSLFGLAAVPKWRWPDYLANEPLKKRYAAITPTATRALADDKVKFFEHCRDNAIDTASILTLVTPLKHEGGHVTHSYSPEELQRVLPPGEYFLKPSNGSHGEGAFSLVVTGSELRWCGRCGSYADFFAYCVSRLEHTRALIVQAKVFNHHRIRAFTKAKGLSTVRVVTVRTGGDIEVIGACLRMAVGDVEIDSFLHGANGNLVAAVDVESGALITGRGSNSKVWPKMTDVAQHPGSGMPIVGFHLPYWAEVIALVSKAHHSIESLHTVGWDVAITDNGPLIIEANWRYDIDILQVAYKTGYKRIIDQKVAA